MGRMVGSVAAALVAATVVAMCAAEPVRAEYSAAIMLQDTPITALDAEKAGTEPPPPPYYPTGVTYADPGMPPPEPPDPWATLTPTPSATPTPPAQMKIDGVRTDRVPTPGQLLFKATRDITFMNPLSWSVNA